MTSLQDEIDALDTEISAEIQRVEDRLRRLYTVRIEVQVTADYVLAWGKQSGLWRLLIHDRAYPDAVCALLNARRHVRAQALTDGWIQKLVDEAGSALTKECEGRRKALSLARDVIIPELDARIKSL